MTTKRPLPTGIKQHPSGYRVWVKVRGKALSKVFPAGTAMQTMTRWRETQRVRAREGGQPAATSETGIGADVRRYLKAVDGMPSLSDRRRDLDRWVSVFGPERIRKTITADEIRAQLTRWRKVYAANTCNHRRTAIMHLWTVLDGKSAPNPARDVPKYPDESLEAPPRALSQAAVTAILDAMPECQTKARCTLLAWTGWPPAQMARLEPVDIDWGAAVRVKPRRKGKGAAGVWLPLLPQAWAALEAFKRLGCWGTFSAASVRKSFRLAARKARRRVARAYARRTMDRAEARRLRAELLDVTPYQLRHSFLSLVAAIAKDDRAVMTLGQHANLRTSHRYTESTVDPRVRAAIGLVEQALGRKVTPESHFTPDGEKSQQNGQP